MPLDVEEIDDDTKIDVEDDDIESYEEDFKPED